MATMEYKMVAKPNMQSNNPNINVKEVGRYHAVQSKKGGSSPSKFWKDCLEVVDFLFLPFGIPEENCYMMLKHYYLSKGEFGWSEKEVFDLLLKLHRKPSHIQELITECKLKFDSKNFAKELGQTEGDDSK